MEKDNMYWFALAAQTVADIVSEHGGAIVMTRSAIIESIRQEDSRLEDCPETVFAHITCCLGRSNLISRSYYGGTDPSILLIFDATKMTRNQARDKCKRDGISEEVRIALFERRQPKRMASA